MESYGERAQRLAEQQFLTPYQISNQTYVSFKTMELVSLIDIMHKFSTSDLAEAKFYFEVVPTESEQSSNVVFNDRSIDEQLNNTSRYQQIGSSAGRLSLFGSSMETINKKDSSAKYIEVELRQIALVDDQSSASNQRQARQPILVVVRNLSKILMTQQKKIDEMYQEAIEKNYSHEQMTPLNCIIGNSDNLRSRFKQIHKTMQRALIEERILAQN